MNQFKPSIEEDLNRLHTVNLTEGQISTILFILEDAVEGERGNVNCDDDEDDTTEFDKDDNYTTALYLHVNGEWRKQKTKEYEAWITSELDMIGLGHLKAICFSPWERVKRNGVRTRIKAPCFITSITTHKSLDDAWKKIVGTKYWNKNRESA